jgi:hypothetical protein
VPARRAASIDPVETLKTKRSTDNFADASSDFARRGGDGFGGEPAGHHEDGARSFERCQRQGTRRSRPSLVEDTTEIGLQVAAYRRQARHRRRGFPFSARGVARKALHLEYSAGNLHL